MAALAAAGRPGQAQNAAASALARGVQLLTTTLVRAEAAGVPRERLAELIGSDAALVDDLLVQGAAATVVARLAPNAYSSEAGRKKA